MSDTARNCMLMSCYDSDSIYYQKKRNATSKGCKLPDYIDIVPIKDDIVTDVRAV